MIDDAIELTRQIRSKNGRNPYEIGFFSPRMQIEIIRSVVATIMLISLVDEPTAGRLIGRLPKLIRSILDRKWQGIMASLFEIREELELSMKSIGISLDIEFKGDRK